HEERPGTGYRAMRMTASVFLSGPGGRKADAVFSATPTPFGIFSISATAHMRRVQFIGFFS
ncbi:MAG: hypothetical protein ACT6T3_21715, partial [Agrobacterium sp.]|uniref:hypothetical protein n=1 Tax=Agrobacterium sp. TaxID=361 RepID=UPI0040337193